MDAPNAMSTTAGLSSGLRSHLTEECGDIRGDLTQIQGLLHDAIEKLTDHFQSLESDSCQQLKWIEALMTGFTSCNDTVFADIDTISRINKDISSHVSGAVTVLQFEDLAQQLIGKVMMRMDRIEETLSGFEGRDAGQPAARIPRITQEDMRAGSVELF